MLFVGQRENVSEL